MWQFRICLFLLFYILHLILYCKCSRITFLMIIVSEIGIFILCFWRLNYFYLKGRSYGKRRVREWFPVCWFTWSQWPIPSGCRGSNFEPFSMSFQGCGRKLHWKWSSRDRNRHPYEQLDLQVEDQCAESPPPLQIVVFFICNAFSEMPT